LGIILFGVIFILLLIPVIITSLFYMERYYKIILKFFRGVNWRGIKFKGNLKWVDLKKLIKSAVIKSLFINSKGKWTVWFAFFLFFLLLSVQFFNIKELYFYVGILFLLLIAFMFAYKHDNKDVNIVGYIFKVFILLLYPLTLLLEFLDNLSNIKLMITIIFFTTVYTFVFLKNVMDIFRSTFVHLTNFIFVYLFFITVVGVAFGAFYYNNNNIFGFFNSMEYKSDESLLIIYKGLEFFYNYPTIIIKKGIFGYIPLFEFILGNLFNIIFVGIFISYFVNKLSTKNERS